MKGILFDLDGTLIDSMNVWANLDISFVESKGKEFDYAHVDELKSKAVEELPGFFYKVYGFESTAEEIYNHMETTMKTHYSHKFEFKDGVKERLDELKAEGFRMCITTATIYDYCQGLLERLNLYDYMDFVLTPDRAGVSKSDPRFFEQAFEKLGTKKDRTYVFDDALYAINNANSVGLKSVGVYDHSSRREQEEIMKASDLYIESFKDLDISRL